MRLALLADGDVGFAITEYLLEYFPADVALIITTKRNEIYALGLHRRFETIIFDTHENLFDEIAKRSVTLGLMAWWPFIIKEPLISLPQNGFVNTHPSLLPHNRGKHFSFWALVEQAPFGVSIHTVTKNIDAGDIIAQKVIEYDWSDTGGSLYVKAQDHMISLFKEVYPAIRAGDFVTSAQQLAEGSYHGSEEIVSASQIDLDAWYPARSLLNLLRAKVFEGLPGCKFYEGGKEYEVSIKIEGVHGAGEER